MKIQSLSTHPRADGHWGEVLQSMKSGALQQNNVAASSHTPSLFLRSADMQGQLYNVSVTGFGEH